MSHENYEEFEPKSKKEPILHLPFRHELESSYLSVKGQRNIQCTDTAATS